MGNKNDKYGLADFETEVKKSTWHLGGDWTIRKGNFFDFAIDINDDTVHEPALRRLMDLKTASLDIITTGLSAQGDKNNLTVFFMAKRRH